MYAYGYFFFFDLIPYFFLLFLFFSIFSFTFFLCILYAVPFGPRLIGVDGAALRRYNGKPNIFWSENLSIFFSYFGSILCPSFTH